MSNSLIVQIRQELQASVDLKTKASFRRFFKEDVVCYGVKTPTVGKIAKRLWRQARTLGKEDLFGLCEELYRSGVTEEAFVVSFWLPNYIAQMEVADLATFKRWIEAYIDNWAKCDGFCNHTVGGLIAKYPESVGELKSWAKSENRWVKRAAAVSLIVPAKRGDFLEDAFEICALLLVDKDDMVQKGYGWLLKEESRMHQAEVLAYVLRNRAVMPRTALRYAIELMSKELKAEAMKKS